MDGSLRRFTMNLCCVVVGMELLAGATVIALLAWFAVGQWAPLLTDLQLASHGSPTIAPADYPQRAAMPPAKPAPQAVKAASENPLVQLRQLQGSPLAGTILEDSQSTEEEAVQFAAALELASSQARQADQDRPLPSAAGVAIPGALDRAGEVSEMVSAQPIDAPELTEQLRSHLYAMADLDEQAGEFERADRWRATARELRRQPAAP